MRRTNQCAGERPPVKSGLWLRLFRKVFRALLACSLLLGLSWSTLADTPKPLTAVLLAARDELPDPNFKDSIVLVLNNLGPVPAGVILNRPTRISVSLLFPDLERLAQLHEKLYFGGPVEIGSVWFLFRGDKPTEHAIRVLEGVYISGDQELLRKLLSRDKPMDGLRIFVGHSAWGPGQLETEIARGDWTISTAEKDAIFSRKSEHPWPEEETPDAESRT